MEPIYLGIICAVLSLIAAAIFCFYDCSYAIGHSSPHEKTKLQQEQDIRAHECSIRLSNEGTDVSNALAGIGLPRGALFHLCQRLRDVKWVHTARIDSMQDAGEDFPIRTEKEYWYLMSMLDVLEFVKILAENGGAMKHNELIAALRKAGCNPQPVIGKAEQWGLQYDDAEYTYLQGMYVRKFNMFRQKFVLKKVA